MSLINNGLYVMKTRNSNCMDDALKYRTTCHFSAVVAKMYCVISAKPCAVNFGLSTGNQLHCVSLLVW